MKKINNFRMLVILVFLINISSVGGFAQAKVDALTNGDKLKSLQLQLDMLTTVQSVDELMVKIRDNVRPSDAIQNVSEVPYSGWAIRQSYKLLMELAKKMTMGTYTPWIEKLDNMNKSTKIVKQVTSFADLAYKIEKAIEEAEISSGADKIRSLAEMIKGISKVIPSSGPVSLYIGEIAKAVNGIAENTEIIENATKEKNKVIDQTKIGRFADEVDEILKYKEELEIIEKNPAIEAIETEIWLLQEKINEKDYAKVYEAKLKCYKEANINYSKFFKVGLIRDKLKFTIARLEGLLETLYLKESMLKFEFSEMKLDLAHSESELTKIKTPNNKYFNLLNKITRLKGDLNRIEKSQKRLIGDSSSIVAKLKNGIEGAKKEYNELDSRLDSFNECVKKHIKNESFEQDNYIEENFPKYISDSNIDISGNWNTGSRTIHISQNGSFITGKYIKLTKGDIDNFGYNVNELSIKGKFDGKTFIGKIHIKFPIEFKQKCPQQWDTEVSIELSLSKDGNMLQGKLPNNILYYNCKLGDGLWVDKKYERVTDSN